MKYQGNPVFPTPPQACTGNPLADCPSHGFGLDKARANELIEALNGHSEKCRDMAAGTVDYEMLMAGPAELDLQSPAEAMFVGHVLCHNSIALQDWQMERGLTASEQGLPKPVKEMLRQMRTEGGGEVHVIRVDMQPGKGTPGAPEGMMQYPLGTPVQE